MENSLHLLPETLAYFLGSLFCFATWALRGFLSPQDRAMQTLQMNLAKAGLVWLSEQDSVLELRESTLLHMRQHRLKGCLLIASGLAFLSWLGLGLSLLLLYSCKNGRSMREQALLESPLARRSDLSSEEVLRLLPVD